MFGIFWTLKDRLSKVAKILSEEMQATGSTT